MYSADIKEVNIDNPILSVPVAAFSLLSEPCFGTDDSEDVR